MPDGSGAFTCDLETWGLLTGEADGDVTREGTRLRAAVLLRPANIISPPSYLWGGWALASTGWSLPAFLLFHTASQMLRYTLDIKVAILVLCRKGNRCLSTLYILLDHRHIISCFSGLHLYMMSEWVSLRLCCSDRHPSAGCCHSPVKP